LTAEDLFSSTTTAAAETTSVPLFENEGSREPVLDPNKDWTAEYIGEGKKFKDVADLAKGKAHSDLFISRLQNEADGLRKELSTRIKLEEFMDRMNSQNSSGANQATQTAGQGNQTDGTASSATSTQDIETLIEQRLAAKEAEQRSTQNLATARARLQEAFGEDFSSELATRTESLGLSKEFVANLAKTQPRALFALLGIDGQQQQATRRDDGLFAPRSSVNTSGLGQGQSQEKNWAHYEKIRKQNPAQYWSTQVQNEIHKQAGKLGERFYS
jgi:hypothetical protein